MRLRKAFAVSFSLLLVSPSSWAVGHIKPGTYPHHKQDMIHKPSAAQMKKFGSLRAAIIGTTTGPKKVAVIIVQFPTSTTISGSNSIASLAAITTRFNNMRSYFNEVSYTQMTSTATYFGPSSAVGEPTAQAAGAYTFNGTGGTPNHPEEYYGCGDEGVCQGAATPVPFSVRANGDYLIRDALNVAKVAHTDLTSSNYDAIVVVHAGNGNETSSANGDIWSIFYKDEVGSTIIASAATGFDEGDVVPDTELGGLSPLGVMCHEFGHELGLPDLYNTVSGTSVVGEWELMDYGPYAGNGLFPSHMGAWDKQFLGWATPQTVGSQGTVAMGYVETNATGMVRINVPNGGPQEYFLIEYRSRTSGGTYDTGIPGDGLLVWHVDDAITAARGIVATNPSLSNRVNDGVPHYGVSIVSADGSPTALGAAGNPLKNGQIFVTPRSDNFSGQPSGVTVVNVKGIGTSAASMDVSALAVAAGLSILKVINYPNPAGKGYAHPNGEGHSTIQFQLSRPAQDYSINLYTLSADLVKKIGKDDISLNITRSADNKWVYEYVWDLTNGGGAHVAPGTYLYLIRADGESKSGKAVIIR